MFPPGLSEARSQFNLLPRPGPSPPLCTLWCPDSCRDQSSRWRAPTKWLLKRRFQGHTSNGGLWEISHNAFQIYGCSGEMHFFFFFLILRTIRRASIQSSILCIWIILQISSTGAGKCFFPDCAASLQHNKNSWFWWMQIPPHRCGKVSLLPTFRPTWRLVFAILTDSSLYRQNLQRLKKQQEFFFFQSWVRELQYFVVFTKYSVAEESVLDAAKICGGWATPFRFIFITDPDTFLQSLLHAPNHSSSLM